MIPAAGIEDQELPVTSKRPGVNNPAVAGRGDLGTGPSGDGQALLGSTGAVGAAELADSRAGDRQTQVAARIGEGDRRRKASGIAQRSEPRLGGGVLVDAVIRGARGARRGIEPGFELGNQIL